MNWLVKIYLALIIFVLGFFSIVGCHNSPLFKTNHLKSVCSEVFQSCTEVKKIENCETFKVEDSNSWINYIVEIEGPIPKEEVENFIDENLVNEEFRREYQYVESFWWYIEGDKDTGSQGVMGISNCEITTNQMYSAWILNDIAMSR